MADPYNQVGVAEVAAALGHQPYLVRTNPVFISDLLLTVWPDEISASLRLLVATPTEGATARFLAYSQRLGNLLNSQIIYIPLDEAAAGLALTTPPIPARTTLPIALLLVQQPRWPLRHILLILQGEPSESALLAWVLRLARPAGTVVTLLLLSPPLIGQPWSRSQVMSGGERKLPAPVQHLARQLTQAGISTELCLRQGSPEAQIRQETAAAEVDLALIINQPDTLLNRITPWFDRPLLIIAAAKGV